MTETAMGFLGIMTSRGHGNPPIAEREFCSQLCRAAPLYNLQVIVFCPDGVAGDGQTVSGYAWENGEWKPARTSAPDVLYNRCLNTGPQEKKQLPPPWPLYPAPFPGRADCPISGGSMKFSGGAAVLRGFCPKPGSTRTPGSWEPCLRKEKPGCS
ncbi:hypothetical protein [Paenibacillus sonchi]|uniref:hypothetical protein n=1 Tax=Paenibacillus sonchi TaxID=373687 RepID=UPI001F45104B|nr:hypothetical protein [Paenibacillus sonchi]